MTAKTEEKEGETAFVCGCLFEKRVLMHIHRDSWGLKEGQQLDGDEKRQSNY